MLNIETLKALAYGAGFNLTANTSFHDPATAPQSSLPFESNIKTCYSVCVAALAFDPADRYRPFNARAGADSAAIESNAHYLRDAARALDRNGLMFIYGLPRDLARYATALSNDLVFRYWITVRTVTLQKTDQLRPEHTGLLLMSKPGASVNRIRIPHARCRHCGETLKDWGGKAHLMHPDGVALSDVWMDLVVDPDDRMPVEVFERIMDISSSSNRTKLLLLASDPSGMSKDDDYHERSSLDAFNPLKWRRPPGASVRAIPAELIDKLHKAPCLDVLKAIPSETVDLAFADPPFNLTKNYNGYSDDRADRDYMGWCKRWLVEYERVLKPGGSMFILNLPRWSVRLADFLTRTGNLYLQNWIVWNALPEPKGVLMPAHYSLLYFTKGERAARFNYCSMENGWEPFDEAVFPPDRPDVCQRRSCVRRRRSSGKTWRGELTDIWHDIHRERRPIKSTNQKKAHPCETPERLLDRIVRLATNPGDVVLDAFAGTGTTAFVARRLDRRFIAIEQDNDYHQVAGRRLSEQRSSWQRAQRRGKQSKVTQRTLQLELRRLAMMLGRLPSVSDVEGLSKYTIEMFEEAFDTWSAALKAAKIALSLAPEKTEQLAIFDTEVSLPEQSFETKSSDYQIN
jgi:site-specific DNA-methyltransferase (adenine-specific)